MCICTLVEVRRHFQEFLLSFLLPHGFQGLNSGPWVWRQVPLSAEPSDQSSVEDSLEALDSEINCPIGSQLERKPSKHTPQMVVLLTSRLSLLSPK